MVTVENYLIGTIANFKATPVEPKNGYDVIRKDELINVTSNGIYRKSTEWGLLSSGRIWNHPNYNPENKKPLIGFCLFSEMRIAEFKKKE